MFDLRKTLARVLGALTLAMSAAFAPAQAQEPMVPASGPALWQLTDEDTTIYLFGTVHVLPADVDWYDARIAKAFDASDELITEIDMSNMEAGGQLMASAAMLQNGQTLRSLMTDDDRAEFEAALTA